MHKSVQRSLGDLCVLQTERWIELGFILTSSDRNYVLIASDVERPKLMTMSLEYANARYHYRIVSFKDQTT